jgi:hypothetical protein
MVMLSILAGVVLALGTVFLTRKLRPATAPQVFAIGLVATAFVYVALALAGRAGARWIGVELIGVALWRRCMARLPTMAVAPRVGMGGARRLGPGVHLRGAGAAFTPAWYPWLCLGFDLPIAIAVIAQGRAKESVV